MVDTLLSRHCTSDLGLPGLGYGSSSEEDEDDEGGEEREEEELSESDEDEGRAWERIRCKKIAFERRMQEMEERQRGRLSPSVLLPPWSLCRVGAASLETSSPFVVILSHSFPLPPTIHICYFKISLNTLPPS